jgi:hypothetical protein
LSSAEIFDAERGLVGGHVDERDVAVGEGVGHAGDDGSAELTIEIPEAKYASRVPATWLKKTRGSATR